MRAVDRSFDDLLRAPALPALKIVNERRSWQGSRLTFSCEAKMGILSAPIKGWIEVTEKDITIDADLGLLESLIAGKQARTSIENRIRGLLK